MTTVLVTGSAGFIGFHVARALLDNGNMVIGLDNFNSYYEPELKRARDAILKGYAAYRPVEGDLSCRETLTRCFEDHAPDLICHLAAQAGVRYSLRNPYVYQQTNVEGFVNLIEQARLSGIRRFVYASSSSVYGGNTKMPYSEDDPVNLPISLYAATKRANELIAYTYTHLWRMQTVGLRFFTVYGAWGRPDMAYWSFLEAILHGEPIRLFNYGRNRRDFTFIGDVVPAVQAALYSGTLDNYEIINLGNNRPESVMDFVHILESLAGAKAITEPVPPEPGDVEATYADIERAKRKLGFQPRTSLQDGLKHFVDWFKEHPHLVEAVRRFRLSSGS